MASSVLTVVSFAFNLLIFVSNVHLIVAQNGILYPQESESREVKCLDGIWDFRLAPRLSPDLGFEQQWYLRPLAQTSGQVTMMPVPSSYNDVTQSKEFRDHVGWAWYDRSFWVPKGWERNKRIFVRFGSAHYHAIVYVNGVQVVEHSGGALPFQAELVSSSLNFNDKNWITVAINNTLQEDSIPQGTVQWQNGTGYPEGYFTLNYNFDFFNYAGIHRSVYLYATPQSYIEDIDVIPTVEGTTGRIQYSIKTVGGAADTGVSVSLLTKEGNLVATSQGMDGELEAPNANLWWPFTMVQDDTEAGYLYTFEVKLVDNEETDVYRLKVGIRSIKWTNRQFLINDKPFYFRGFGRHEDFDVRGKGIDNVMLVKDHNLVKWTGANSYRTSHYPYAEEIMDLTDRLGIVVIDEVAAVALNGFGPNLLANHKKQMSELIQRDKNRPSVAMWSVANEPVSNQAAAENYFKEVIEVAKSQDPMRRPVTSVLNQGVGVDVTAQFVDILCFNRYPSWYHDAGHTELITDSIIEESQNWINKYDRPLIMAEYGADTVAGLHMSPESMFTEEYQTTVMREHFKAFDFLRKNTSFIGEHIWNFADFMTAQGITRITGNRKGIFSRDRQPKSSAHLIRQRYHLLANEFDGYQLPQDLMDSSMGPVYESDQFERPYRVHDEH